MKSSQFESEFDALYKSVFTIIFGFKIDYLGANISIDSEATECSIYSSFYIWTAMTQNLLHFRKENLEKNELRQNAV
jgi:hypothetical protein